MPDMLVRLYALPELEPALAAARDAGAAVRRALAPERDLTVGWVREHFGQWAAETAIAFARTPVGCFVAVHERSVVGFACVEATAPGFFGPTGVVEPWRGRGVGRALLLAALHAQRALGYAYAIIGGAGPVEWYRHEVGATVIEDSVPGPYAGMLLEPAPGSGEEG